MSSRARFAGMEAAIGLVVFLVMWVFGLVGSIGVIALVAVGEIPITGANMATVVGGLVVFVLFSWKILRDSRLVREIEIDDQDNWILRSAFGIVRGKLGPTEPRTFEVLEQKRWILTGTARRMTASWAVITAGARVWKTTMNPPAAQRPAIDMVRAWLHSRS